MQRKLLMLGLALLFMLVNEASYLAQPSLAWSPENLFGFKNKSKQMVSLLSYGADPKGEKDSTAAFTKAIKELTSREGGILFLPPGRYLVSKTIAIPSRIWLKGAGRDLSIIDAGEGSFGPVLKTAPVIITKLKQTKDLRAGENRNEINNNALSGDFIVYRTKRRFTAEWDEGLPIRKYYLNGELLKVAGATPQAVDFTERATLDLLVKDLAEDGEEQALVEVFSPVRNVGISDLTIRRRRTTDVSGSGIWLDRCEGAVVRNIKTINQNNSGVTISLSREALVENITVIGGTNNLGLNYGIAVVNGSKYINVRNIHANGCRHAVTAGAGAGIAIPMWNSINGITAENSQSISIDAHGGTLGFIITNGNVDYGLDISGIGHTVSNINSSGGAFYLGEGGTDNSFSNIVLRNAKRFTINRVIKRCKFRNISIGLRGWADNVFFRGYQNEFDGLRIINLDFRKATTNKAADQTIPNSRSAAGFRLQPGTVLKNSYFEGFPIGIYLDAPNCVVENIFLKNCGWDSGRTYYESVLLISKNADDAIVSNLSVLFDQEKITKAEVYVVNALNILGERKGARVKLDKISYHYTQKKDHVYDNGARIQREFNHWYISNIFLEGTSRNEVLCSGKFINNNIVKDN